MTSLIDYARKKLAAALEGGDKCNAKIVFAGGEHELSVRRFSVDEGMSQLFHVSVTALSSDPAIDLDDLVGKGAALAVFGADGAHARVWSGICAEAEQFRSVDGAEGLSTYTFAIAPELWRLTMRTNLRIYQHVSLPDIAKSLLSEWKITPVLELTDDYPKLEYKVQYEETDFAFLERVLQEAGISFYFRQVAEHGKGHDVTKLVLADKPQSAQKRAAPLPYLGHGSFGSAGEHSSSGTMSKSLRHGKLTLRDHDFLQPPHKPLFTSATPEAAQAKEAPYEDYRWLPGAGWTEGGAAGSTPVADQLGVARTNETAAKALAARMLDAERATRDVASFATNAPDLAVGMVVAIGYEVGAKVHPHPALSPNQSLLVTHAAYSGGAHEDWHVSVTAVFASVTHRPALTAVKPRIWGLQSAIVVGPEGSEVHTDEHGRVRVQFHWDREGKYDGVASCWIRVGHPWAGGSFGFFHVPRVGHEVLVSFFDGDPDRPVIVGSLHNVRNQVPTVLPADKATSVWRSQSTPSPSKDAEPGYNEISFVDDYGAERLNVQAQRDLRALVKNDEHRDVGQNRTTVIGKKDVHHVGETYTLTVGSGVTITVDHGKRVVITTGGATITLDDGDIALHASGQITVAAGGGLTLSSTGGSVKIDGPKVYLNCAGPTAAAPVAAGTAASPKPGVSHGGPPYRPQAGKTGLEPIATMDDVDLGGA